MFDGTLLAGWPPAPGPGAGGRGTGLVGWVLPLVALGAADEVDSVAVFDLTASYCVVVFQDAAAVDQALSFGW